MKIKIDEKCRAHWQKMDEAVRFLDDVSSLFKTYLRDLQVSLVIPEGETRNAMQVLHSVELLDGTKLSATVSENRITCKQEGKDVPQVVFVKQLVHDLQENGYFVSKRVTRSINGEVYYCDYAEELGKPNKTAVLEVHKDYWVLKNI